MNLIIVDDEIYVVRAIQKNIDWKKLGINQVFAAFNTKRAKEIFKQEKIDILITDIEMPIESGLELLAWVRENQYPCKAVCITSHVEIQYAQKAISYGTMEYLLKPMDFLQLTEIIKKVIKKIEEERKQEDQRNLGLIWESNYEAVESVFWEKLVTENNYKNPEVIFLQAQKMKISYDVNEQFVPLLFSVRRICERKKDWEYNRELMHYTLYNIALDVFLEKEDAQKNGWIGEVMWVVLSSRFADGLDEKLNTFLTLGRKILGIQMAVYKGTFCFGEELCQEVKKLRTLDRENVSWAHGIIGPEMIRAESGFQEELFLDMKKLLKEKDWEGLLQWLDGICKKGRIIGERELYLETCAVQNEIYHFMEENRIHAEDFWTDELIKKTDERRRSLEGLREWMKSAIVCLKKLMENKKEENELIVRMKEYIRENLEEGITRDHIAEQVHFSNDYTSRFFKKETGVSLSEYIIIQKIERAKELIVEGNESIGEIAVRLGYNSFSYFSEVFKRFTGDSPSDYKRKTE